MAHRLRHLAARILEAYGPRAVHGPAVLLGGMLLAGALPVWAADAAEDPAQQAASNDAVLSEAPEEPEDAPGRPAPGGTAATATPRTRWGAAPVRWGGTLSTAYRLTRSDATGSTGESIYEGRLRANSYLVQPWIARISADLSLTTVSTAANNDGSPAASNLRATSVTGDTGLNLFPMSRFPFQASLSLSDSRTDGSLANSDYARQRLSMRQEYRPARGNWRSFGQYDHSRLSGSFGDDVVDRLGGGLTLSGGAYDVNMDGSYSRATRSSGDDATDLIGMARHSYRHNDALQIETMATYTDSAYTLGGPLNATQWQNRSLQAVTFGSWTPAESPWRATGNLRYFQTRSGSAGGIGNGNMIGGTGSLSYYVSRNLSVFATAGVNASSSGGQRLTSTNQSAGLSYSGTPLTFGKFSYNWYGSANLASSSGGEATQRSFATNGGHTLQRDWTLSDSTALSASFGQTLSNTRSSGIESLNVSALSHTAGLSLRAMTDSGLVGYIGVSVSDSRTRSDTASSFQMLNLQASGTWRVSNYAEFSANFTWQQTRQDSEVIVDPLSGLVSTSRSNDGSLSGNLNFSHSRLFGVRDLRYTLRYSANTYQTDTRFSGNPDATRERITRDFDQRLKYRIGRLNTELLLRMAEVDGKENALLFFKVSRDFGAY